MAIATDLIIEVVKRYIEELKRTVSRYKRQSSLALL